jgi:DHA3 family tetracycline resistance protein-like MFS transporter
VGLDPLRLVLAGTLQQVICFVFQAPPGALADLYSRRWAIVSSLGLMGAGLLIEGMVPTFAAVLGAQVLYGLGATLMDGADAAWIADEVGPEHAGPLYLRATQIGWLATLPGIALSVALASVRLSLPIALGGGLYLVLGAVLALVMPEQHFTPAAGGERTASQQMGATLRGGRRLVRGRRVLLIIGTGVLFGIADAGFGRLWQYHLLHTFGILSLGGLKPIAWFGAIEVMIALARVMGIQVARRWVDTSSHRGIAWTLLVASGLMAIGTAGFALAEHFVLALAALWLLTMAHGPRMPLERAWMNQQLDASVRATVFSLRGHVDAFASIVGGPLLGALATAVGTHVALVAAGGVLALALPLYARTLRREQPPVLPITSGTPQSNARG